MVSRWSLYYSLLPTATDRQQTDNAVESFERKKIKIKKFDIEYVEAQIREKFAIGYERTPTNDITNVIIFICQDLESCAVKANDERELGNTPSGTDMILARMVLTKMDATMCADPSEQKSYILQTTTSIYLQPRTRTYSI